MESRRATSISTILRVKSNNCIACSATNVAMALFFSGVVFGFLSRGIPVTGGWVC